METIDKAANSAHEAIDKVASATHQAAETVGEKGEQLKNAEQQLMENYHRYVRDNPIASLGIAAAAGFLLSRVLDGHHTSKYHGSECHRK
ncbi:MAG: DUF883 domain-containing protein [Methylococcales bacterium]|nr:DUF883 domain-containing protein [Methylococcales bacterium]